jgi:hypothetical protein
MNIKIAIPTFQRKQIFLNKTWKFLMKHNIPKKDIYIFVVDYEYEWFKATFPDCKVIVSRRGVKETKNYIGDYFDKDEYILIIDDDLSDIYTIEGECKKEYKLKSIDNLTNLLNEMLDIMIKSDAGLCGLYPIKNPYFMEKKISENLRYCPGAFILFYNQKIERNIDLLEDYEFTLLNYLKYDKVIRFNHYCIDANCYTLPGGIQALGLRNKNSKESACGRFVNLYKNYCKVVLKADGWHDIRFINDISKKEDTTIEDNPATDDNKIKCECGSVIGKAYYARHIKSKLHLKNLEKKTNNIVKVI